MGRRKVASARWNPLIVFVVCVVLVALNLQRQKWLLVIPAAVLGLNAGLSFVFWMFRLKRNRRGSWLPLVIAIGSTSRAVGLASLLVLIATSVILLVEPKWVTDYLDQPAAKFWVLWGWTTIELIHSHVYKLALGSRDTLEHVLRGPHWAEAGTPLRGAIGQQLRKLQRQRVSHDRGGVVSNKGMNLSDRT
jgi:hypothetical protein